MSAVKTKSSRRRKRDMERYLESSLEEASDVVGMATSDLEDNVKQLLRDVGFRPLDISNGPLGIEIGYLTKERPVTAVVGTGQSYIIRWEEVEKGARIIRTTKDGQFHAFQQEEPEEMELDMLAELIREKLVEQGQDSDLDE